MALLAAVSGLVTGAKRGMRSTGFQKWVIRQLDQHLGGSGGTGLTAAWVEVRLDQGALHFHRVVVLGSPAARLEIGLDLRTLAHVPHLGRVRLVDPGQAPPPGPAVTAPEGRPRRARRLPARPQPAPPPPAAAPEPVPAVPARPPAPAAPPEPVLGREVMLFTVLLGDRVVAENVPGYPLDGQAWLLPLGAFCRAVSLGVKVDRAAGQAKGFIVSEDRTFHLDLARAQVEADGKRHPLDRARVEWIEDDLFVADGYLSRWFPLTVSVDPRAAVIQVDPLEPLPIQGAWAREARKRPARPGAGNPGSLFPLLKTPYALWDPPFIDQTLDIAYHPEAGEGQPKVGLSGSTFMAGDLGFMSSKLFFSSRSGNLFENERFSLYRKDPNAGLLGPMGARVVELGYFYAPSPALVGGTYEGKGVHIGNFPERLQAATDRYTFHGDLPQDWSVELFQNNALIDYQSSGPDGLYAFREVPLRYGVNDFLLVFHGPEGQRREERRRLDLSQSQIPERALLYNMSGSRSSDGQSRFQFEAAYGLTRQLDFRASAIQLEASAPPGSPEPVVQKRYTAASAQGYWPGFSTWAGVARDEHGGTVTSAKVSTGWLATSLSLQQSVLANGLFSPEFTPTHGLIAARTEGRLDFSLKAGSWLPVPLQVSLDESRDTLAEGGRDNRTTGRLALYSRGYYVSNQITWDRVTSAGGSQESREGLLLVSKTFRNFGLRGDIGYDLDGLRPSARTLELQADTSIWRPWTVSGTISRNLTSSDNQISLLAMRQTGPVGLRLLSSYSGTNGFYAGVGLNVSVGREPRRGRWVASAAPMAGDGAVSALAYVDHKGAGSKDSGAMEPADGGLNVGGMPRHGFSLGGGVVFQPNLPAHEETAISLDEGSLEDPFLKPTVRGYRVIPRPGKVIPLDFPLAMGGELTGTTRILRDGRPVDLAGLRLELLGPDGKLRAQATSAFDGFFDLVDLPFGRYTLWVAAGEADRLRVELPPPQVFEIGSDGTLIDGIQVLVVPRPPVPPPPAP